jgi:hypothetical protein
MKTDEMILDELETIDIDEIIDAYTLKLKEQRSTLRTCEAP